MAEQVLKVWVHTLRHEAQDTLSVELHPIQGQTLPAFEAGAHIDLHLPNSMVRSYSLCNDSRERHRYVVAVLKDRASRGGSRCVHEQLRIGTELTISAPRNNFVLHENAEHSVLIAGGIGVTPILCMAQRLHELGHSFEVMCFARSRQHMAFIDKVQALGAPVHWHFDDEQGGPPPLKALLAQRQPSSGTHHYACGPAVMLDTFEQVCAELGHPHAHIERFAAVEVKAADDAMQSYTVQLKRSGKTLEVTPDLSLHKALLAAKTDIPFSCEEGVCGSCETRVLEGVIDHRDSVLSPAERATNRVMMVCVSGCKSERLVLDL